MLPASCHFEVNGRPRRLELVQLFQCWFLLLLLFANSFQNFAPHSLFPLAFLPSFYKSWPNPYDATPRYTLAVFLNAACSERRHGTFRWCEPGGDAGAAGIHHPPASSGAADLPDCVRPLVHLNLPRRRSDPAVDAVESNRFFRSGKFILVHLMGEGEVGIFCLNAIVPVETVLYLIWVDTRRMVKVWWMM